ncbi:MAG: DNA-processing protein DprA [Planctomycetaceae bacterium]|nr:DNA-processing protein DprA [Planctomycetaceae bacterium]
MSRPPHREIAPASDPVAGSIPVSESHDQRDLIDCLTLSLTTGVGPLLQANLLQQFGSATAVLQQTVSDLLSVKGVGPQVASQLVSRQSHDRAAQTLQDCQKLGVSLRRKSTGEYPASLQEVADAPSVLYVRGEYLAGDELAIGIVGSRRCTAYGRKQAQRLAAGLARAGFCVISGLARGIDAVAHRAALDAGGRTIAVMATGVRQIYPPEHAELAMDIVEQGAVVSEFPLDQRPSPGLFPQRNRIISGLSLGVVVIEATRNSGALYTARHAMEQGREVFAVPGHVDSLGSEGCHDLIRDGVTLVRGVDDILEELGPLSKPTVTSDQTVVHDPREMTLNPREKEILALIGTSATAIDDIIRTSQLEMSRVLSTITVLEMKRFVRRVSGTSVIRSN